MSHAVARERIERQVRTWNAEHPGWDVTLQIPARIAIFSDWSLLMSHQYGDDPTAPKSSWYNRYVMSRPLVKYLGERATLSGALHTINGILLQMQREIGMLHSG